MFITPKNKIESFITNYTEVNINDSIDECLNKVDPISLGECLTQINEVLDNMLV